MNEIDPNSNIDLSLIGKTGLQAKLTATAETLKEMADACGAERVEAYSGEVVLKPWRKTGFSLAGSFRAELVQTCVVTLEPVPSVIEEEFTLQYLPADEIDEPIFEPEAEVDLAFDAPDPPEPLEGGMLDLFGVLVEQLSLALEPYPRADGAVWSGDVPEDSPDNSAHEHPFAALSGLKDGKKP